jgi:alpha-1,6-mannosyltransferase
LRDAASSWLNELSGSLAITVERIADVAAAGAEKYLRHVFSQSDVALAASPAQAARLKEYGISDAEIVPMGVDLDLFDPQRRSSELRGSLGAKGETVVLLYAGRFSTEKRISVVLEAFWNLPRELNAHLWLVGDGPQRAEIRAATGGDARIRLLPHEGDRVRFATLLASADIYVTAGPFETFGLSVAEAQASGLAVVGVDAGALRDRVKEGLGFLGPVDDAGAMALNIARAAKERTAIGARARAHIAEQFSWPGAFARMVQCYEERFGGIESKPIMPLPMRPTFGASGSAIPVADLPASSGNARGAPAPEL